jgi:hypothetical protein
MSYVKIGTQVAKTVTKYGKHKIPRFIYHMTNKSNYESMLKDGVIKTTNDDFFGKGVFATELTNLFKRWRNNKSWGGYSLQKRLIKHASKGSDDIVILKIPTKNLKQDLLKVRSQNTLFNWVNSENADKIYSNVSRKIHKIPREEKGWIDKFLSILKTQLLKTNQNSVLHVIDGAPAKDASLLKQRKQALEYIYQEDIPISSVEKIGEVNLTQLRSSAEYNPTKPVRSLFTSLLKGTPEVKGAELLNC